jgi:hypothetical protein
LGNYRIDWRFFDREYGNGIVFTKRFSLRFPGPTYRPWK